MNRPLLPQLSNQHVDTCSHASEPGTNNKQYPKIALSRGKYILTLFESPLKIVNQSIIALLRFLLLLVPVAIIHALASTTLRCTGSRLFSISELVVATFTNARDPKIPTYSCNLRLSFHSSLLKCLYNKQKEVCPITISPWDTTTLVVFILMY